MNKELARTLTVALVSYLDENRPEGTMDCSSGECVSLEKAFTEENFDSVETLIKKKLSRLTEFQDAVRVMITKALTTHIKDGNGREMSSTVFIDDDTAILLSAGLLELAKKELARRDEVITLDNLPPYDKGFQDGKAEAITDLERTFECNPEKLPLWLQGKLGKKHLEGYIMGRENTMREMKDFIELHFNCDKAREGTYYKDYERNPEPVPTGIPYQSPQCGTNVTIVPNTNSGTSASKAEG